MHANTGTERVLNKQVVIVAAVALVTLVIGSIILSSAGVDVFGTADWVEIDNVMCGYEATDTYVVPIYQHQGDASQTVAILEGSQPELVIDPSTAPSVFNYQWLFVWQAGVETPVYGWVYRPDLAGVTFRPCPD